MKRKFRLKSPKHFQRVRHTGKSIAHPLIVLAYAPNDKPHNRFGIITSKTIGNAVTRNRIKRWLRECLRSQMKDIKPGWDIVIIARKPVTSSSFQEINRATSYLLEMANLKIANTVEMQDYSNG